MTYQLPSYSPLTLPGLFAATADAVLRRGESRATFESELARRFDACGAIAVGSGTQALQLAMLMGKRAAGEAPAALPAYSCYDVATAALGARASVVFYDIDPVSLGPVQPSLEQALASGASSVVAAYLYGFPIDWERTRTACRTAGAVLIEDAAQGLGSSLAGAEAGRNGDLVVLSFGRGKGWTGGGGGALLVRDARLAPMLDECRALVEEPGRMDGFRTLVFAGAQWLLGRPALYGLPAAIPGLRLGETVFKEPGALREAPVACIAIARRHRDASAAEVVARRSRAAEWTAALTAAAIGSRCTPLPDGTCGYLRFPLRLEEGVPADSIVHALAHRGIARGYPVPLPELPEIRPMIVRGAPCPGATELARSLVTAPTHSRVRSGEPRETVSLLRDLLTRARTSQ